MEQGAGSMEHGAWSKGQGACKDPPAGGDEVPRIGRAWSKEHPDLAFL